MNVNDGLRTRRWTTRHRGERIQRATLDLVQHGRVERPADDRQRTVEGWRRGQQPRGMVREPTVAVNAANTVGVRALPARAMDRAVGVNVHRLAVCHREYDAVCGA